MNVSCDLRGIGVLVTRPERQAGGLCERIEASGGMALPFPAIRIDPTEDAAAAQLLLSMVAGDTLIFVSPNAVTFGLQLLDGERLPDGIRLAAVGKGTARVLMQAGYPPDVVPPTRFDSEGLLATPELQQIVGRRIVIVRGVGGRALLGETLKQRGAEVSYAEVYRRQRPVVDVAPMLAGWPRRVQVVTATSNDILTNLAALLGDAGRQRLCLTPLLVISPRMVEEAQRMGFEQIVLADGADDESIVRRLCEWQVETN
ncbi:MAG: uroporphyrinogen-III synthase [gamma proteobacterium endosymbiont of Lamellibrachia anaximandri]|nr:uroporphyrinogen-III synthase [gamma proteobacterium endosymbiont of Lamellibrachia anaximandri]MBL3618211.1 uroporphyrinogen-III synthase [gamma proteobacterium endosymbiont of Lamellibrachia anaximandri]